MWVTIEENRVYVKLSRRNLRELQAMLDNRTGHRRSLGRLGDNGVVLVVEVEDDSEHYGGRAPGPGLCPVVYQCRGSEDGGGARYAVLPDEHCRPAAPRTIGAEATLGVFRSAGHPPEPVAVPSRQDDGNDECRFA